MDDFKGWMLRHKLKSEGPTQEVCNIYIYIKNSQKLKHIIIIYDNTDNIWKIVE